MCDCGAAVLCILILKQGANEAHPQRTLSGKVTLQTHTHRALYIAHTKSDIAITSITMYKHVNYALVAASVWRNVAHAKRKTWDTNLQAGNAHSLVCLRSLWVCGRLCGKSLDCSDNQLKISSIYATNRWIRDGFKEDIWRAMKRIIISNCSTGTKKQSLMKFYMHVCDTMRLNETFH